MAFATAYCLRPCIPLIVHSLKLACQPVRCGLVANVRSFSTAVLDSTHVPPAASVVYTCGCDGHSAHICA